MREPFAYVRGAELPPSQQREALACYVHRFTRSHRPAWAREPWRPAHAPAGLPYPVQFASDSDWLANTLFPVTKTGRLASSPCESSPTWPDNPELRRPAGSLPYGPKPERHRYTGAPGEQVAA